MSLHTAEEGFANSRASCLDASFGYEILTKNIRIMIRVRIRVKAQAQRLGENKAVFIEENNIRSILY